MFEARGFIEYVVELDESVSEHGHHSRDFPLTVFTNYSNTTFEDLDENQVYVARVGTKTRSLNRLGRKSERVLIVVVPAPVITTEKEPEKSDSTNSIIIVAVCVIFIATVSIAVIAVIIIVLSRSRRSKTLEITRDLR